MSDLQSYIDRINADIASFAEDTRTPFLDIGYVTDESHHFEGQPVSTDWQTVTMTWTPDKDKDELDLYELFIRPSKASSLMWWPDIEAWNPNWTPPVKTKRQLLVEKIKGRVNDLRFRLARWISPYHCYECDAELD